MFQEALRSARRVQQLVAVTAAIIGLFALSVLPSEDLYSRARAQISEAVVIMWSDYSRWLKDRMDTAAEARRMELQQWKPRESFGLSGGGKSIEDAWLILDELRIPGIRDRQIVNREALKSIAGMLNVSTHTISRSSSPIPPNLQNHRETTPLDVLRFVKSVEARQNAVLVSVSPERARDALWSEIARAVLDQDRYEPTRVLALRITYEANATTGGARPDSTANDGEDALSGEVIYSIRGEWLGEPAEDDSSPDRVVGFRRIGQDVQSQRVQYRLQETPVERTSVVTWLQEHHPALGAIDAAGEFVPFYGLEHVWREIADRPLTDSELYLSALESEERRRGESVTVIGLTVPAALVPIAGPVALLTLMIHLSQLIVHLRRRGGDHVEDLREFAWSVLHAKRGWWVEPLVSLVVLPLTAQALIAWKLRDAEPVWVTAGWVVIGLAVVVAIGAWRHLAKLRHF